MPKELTADQRQFIERYLTGKSRREQVRVQDAYMDYLRRRQAVVDALAQLPAGDTERARLEVAMARPDTMVNGRGQFKEAYDQLADIKKAAVLLAKGYVAGQTPGDLRLEVERLRPRVTALGTNFSLARRGMQNLVARAERHAKAEDAGDMEEAFSLRKAFTETEASWRGSVETYREQMEGAAESSDAIQLGATLGLLAHRVKVMTEHGTAAQKKAALACGQELATIHAHAHADGKMLTGDEMRSLFAAHEAAFEAALKLIKTVGRFQGTREQEPKQAQFAELDRREEQRLRGAQERYEAQMRRDFILTPQPGQMPPARRRPDLRTFRAEDVMPQGVDALDDAALTDQRIRNATMQTAAKFRRLVQTEPLNSDVVFDLMLKSEDEVRAELARALNLSADEGEWSENQRRLVQSMADEVNRLILQLSPNKVAPDMSTLSLNGKQFGRPEKIGSGGLGDIYRYTAEDGDKVIAKVLKVELFDRPGAEEINAELPMRKRKEMAEEMRIHRKICGGERGEGHPNLVRMRGAAVGPEGKLVMLMDEAEGGDLGALSKALNGLGQTGVVPQQALDAIVQRNMLQAVMGLKALHANGMMHLDIKQQNYLLDGDGNVQLADFGSTREVDDDGKVDTQDAPTTKPYAPENMGARMNPQEEVYWLGGVLETLRSDMQAEGAIARHGGRTAALGKARTSGPDGEPNRQTAFDRLRNAMMAEDPEQRPSLDGVLLSSYLADAEEAFSREDIDALMKAAMAYSRKVGREGRLLLNRINGLKGTLLAAEDEGLTSIRDEDAIFKPLPVLRELLKEAEAQYAALNARPDVAPLIDAVRQAGRAFAG